jgi:hypothetical protein
MESNLTSRLGLLRTKLARNIIEKSSIITSISSLATSSTQMQKAIRLYAELDAEAREIVSEMRSLTEDRERPGEKGPPQFYHRLNSDGTVDTICARCFITIAHKEREDDLEPWERAHDCDPEVLQRHKQRLS